MKNTSFYAGAVILITALLFSALPALPASAAAIRFVAPTAQGNGDCFSWANACTLQTALSEEGSGYEIWVKAGVYYPGVAGNRNATFTLKSGVGVYGGFSGSETSRDERNWRVNKTILSGDIDGNDTNTDGNNIAESPSHIQGSNSYQVVTGSGTDDTAVLDGFIITAGQANGSYPKSEGGGMFNLTGSPTLMNITFSGNTAITGGGGITNESSSSPTLTNVTFSGNSATVNGSGGGMFNYISSSPTLTNVTFSGNSASYDGGGISNWSNSNPTLTNVTLYGNSASWYGGGMDNFVSSNPTLKNVVIWGNTSSTGAGIYNNGSTPNISFSDIQGCGSSASWNSDCGTNSGDNINSDPDFVDAPAGNLRLNFGSPAIDTGTNSVCPLTDLDELPRPADGDGDEAPICDMGAFEAGEMLCSAPYTFNSQSGVSITITDAGNLGCIYVDEMEISHPNASPGIQNGRYWLIRGLQSDKSTTATGFSLTLTLPTSFTADGNDMVCRYPGNLGGAGWDCAASSYTGNSITRTGVGELSEWAVGDNVSPTAVKFAEMKINQGSGFSIYQGLLLLSLVIGFWSFRKLQKKIK